MTADHLPPPPSATAGESLTAVAQQVVDDLTRRWGHAAAYLLIDGRLRCTAAQGPFPVPDGLAPGGDPLGRAVTTRRTVVVTGEPAGPEEASVRICAPVVVDGTATGVVVVVAAADPSVPAADLAAEAASDAEAAAVALAAAVPRSAASAGAPLGQRLAGIAVDVAGASDDERLVRVVVEAACVLTGWCSAALALVAGGGRWTIRSATGPLAQAMSGWTSEDVAALARQLPVPASVHLAGRQDGPAELAFVAAAGAAAASVHPLVVGGTVTGLLVVADAEAHQRDPVSAAAVEVLAALAAAALRSATLQADLAERAREALTGVRTAEDFRDDLTESCIDAIRSGEVTHTSMRLRPEAEDDAEGTLGALVEALTGQLRHGDRLYRLEGRDFAILLATGEPDSAGAVAARLERAAHDAGAPVTLGWALVDGPPAAVGAATERALEDAGG